MSSPVKKIAEIDLLRARVFGGPRCRFLTQGAQEIRRRGKKPSGLTRFEVAETGGKIRRIVRHFSRAAPGPPPAGEDLLQGRTSCRAKSVFAGARERNVPRRGGFTSKDADFRRLRI